MQEHDTPELSPTFDTSPSDPFANTRLRFLLPLLFIAIVIVLAIAQSFPFFKDQQSQEMLSTALLSMLAYSVALLILWMRSSASSVSDLFGKLPDKKACPSLLALGIPMIGLAAFCIYLVYYPLSFVAPDLVYNWILDEPDIFTPSFSPSAIISNLSNIFTIVILAPLAEELLFRGYLFSRLRKHFGVITAVTVSSLLFGVLHPDILGAFIFAIFMCYLRFRYRSIIAPILVHFSNNFLAVLIEVIYMVSSDDITEKSISEFRSEWWMALIGGLIAIPWLYRYWQRELKTVSLTTRTHDQQRHKQ